MMNITPYTSLNLRSTSRSVMRNVKAKLRFRQKIVKSHDAHVCHRNPARSKHITWLAPINPAAPVTRIFIFIYDQSELAPNHTVDDAGVGLNDLHHFGGDIRLVSFGMLSCRCRTTSTFLRQARGLAFSITYCFNSSMSPLIRASFLALDQPWSCLSLLYA